MSIVFFLTKARLRKTKLTILHEHYHHMYDDRAILHVHYHCIYHDQSSHKNIIEAISQFVISSQKVY